MEQITSCNKCDISLNNNIVNGTGNINGGIIFIGEAPGYREQKYGIPFIGNSGKLLDIMLDLIGLHRSDVYITNVIKCRPTNNRNPLAIEIANCRPNLVNEFRAIKPRVVVLLGGVALNMFFKTSNLTINKVKGYVIPYRGIKVIGCYHPAYILRNFHNKSIVHGYVNSFRTIGNTYKEMINPLIDMKI